MSLHKKLMHICNDRDLSNYLDMLHDEFTVIFHKSGNSFLSHHAAYMKTVKSWLTIVLCLIQMGPEKL